MTIVILVDYNVTTTERLPGASSLRWASSAQFTDGETEVQRGAGTNPKARKQKPELGFLVWSRLQPRGLLHGASDEAEPTKAALS